MKRIGAYEVHEVVGRGGMGAVFRAQAPDGRVVALKLLLRTVSNNLERFERERRILERLGEEEGFVSFLDAGTAPDGAFLVMGFAEGGSLRGRLGRERFTIAEAIALGTKLARAIGRAHELGIVHRDLKPENILFDANGEPLVADLGLAKHFRADVTGASQSVSLSQAGELRGTAGYMAREQMLDARSADASADVFALGAILYECLAGEPAFVGATVIELVSLIEKGEVAPLRTRRADVPRWLDDAVLRALSPERADRFPDGHAFAAALEAGGKRRRSPL
ncbi:MAG: serine/threonine-protein kinase, partial [Planctomycetota bacterium]